MQWLTQCKGHAVADTIYVGVFSVLKQILYNTYIKAGSITPQ